MSAVPHCAYLLSLRAYFCALVILCPVYHLHTSHVIMISFAGGGLNEIPLRAQLPSSPPLQGIVAHASSWRGSCLSLLLPAEPRSCSRNWMKHFFGRMFFIYISYSLVPTSLKKKKKVLREEEKSLWISPDEFVKTKAKLAFALCK